LNWEEITAAVRKLAKKTKRHRRARLPPSRDRFFSRKITKTAKTS
jgi:hypothetical protein